MLEPIPSAGFVEIQGELTNEEINKIAQEHGVIVDAGVYEFARAILRKAQEK